MKNKGKKLFEISTKCNLKKCYISAWNTFKHL